MESLSYTRGWEKSTSAGWYGREPQAITNFFRGDRFNGAVVTFQGQRMFINEVRVALQDFAVVALIEPLTHMGLLVNDAVGMVKNVGEGGAKKAGVVAVERVLVKLDNTADGVAERFRRDGSQWVQPPPTLW
ncbi:Uncharacterised protein [Raoultella terrigena]|uniref:Uncharacterized protein n=1 Tax=Raoultella terrigena TaxID=577 RepID=A0A3P8M5A9_RAOTE|nr:Uncharacterised protein [Raoultella terrigena]